ncbi:MFS transporter [Mucilaginibacter daejeonensis]|uniref:MFS transporter n=1 Tax=Mucilaginibacter daejeonensis TaxID=398049 RepID=UPI001D1733CE|nr:MFS transporter [Mucilaginibacter daejeonensis]UEG55098.1 MFS transporter [Mucilaginibacter daejeonensis]
MTHPTNRSARELRIGCAVFFFISGFGYSSWASRIPTVQQRLHFNEAQLGSLLFALPIGLMLTMPITGNLLSRYTSRSIMIFGAMVFNVVLCLLGLATEAWQFAIILFAFGSGRNLLNLSVNAQSVGVQSLYTRSVITTFHGIWSLAGFAGAAVGYLMVKLNICLLYHLGSVSILLFILSAYFYSYTFYQKPKPVEKKPLFLLPDKHMLKFAVICFACMACENTMYDWSAIYFEKAVQASRSTSTGAFVAYMVAMTIVRFTGDKMVTRFGIKNMLKYSGWFIFGGLLLAVALPYTVPAIAGFMLVGAGVSCVVPLVFSIAGRSATLSSGAAIASISSVGYLGFLLVPPFVGYVAQAAGMRWSFGLIALLGALIVIMVRKIEE